MIPEQITKEFQASLRGRLIQPHDADYDASRKVYNGMFDKRPAMIARCADVADVIAAVNFARKNKMLLAIKGGGHNAAGLGSCDNGLVIDLSPMKGIHIEMDKKTARVQAGCVLGDVDHATHAFGMAIPSGIMSTTGISGLTLGGGLGHLSRKFGLTIDSLIEADIVLADGSYVKASAKKNKDLFWALRGGGGNFGVVTSFLFKMSPVSTVYGGPMFWHMDDAKEMLHWYREFIQNAPNEINGFFSFQTVPPFAPFPENLHAKKTCGIVWCYTGPLKKAEKIFKAIRKYKTPVLDWVGPITVPALQSMFDPLLPTGLQWYWKADFINELSDEAIELHIKHGSQLPSLLSLMHLYPIDGAGSKVPKNETAWNYRDAKWAMVIAGIDPDPANRESITRWAKEYWNALHPHSAGGAYINFMMDEGDERIKATYGDNYERMVDVKTKYDPQNLFRVNQNIRPAVLEHADN